ncbi:MAG: 50S ribosomal protein L3 [Nanoarchaeota archaeon]
MPTRKSPRKGSLQYWPRKRASKFLPSVNWNSISTESKGLKGIIAYKAGMMSAHVKDKTPDSMTKGKKIAIPVTILECPNNKIFSVRFYKNGIVVKEVLAENLDKELSKKIKLPHKKSEKLEDVKENEYDDIRVIIYSEAKKTEIKKIPDLSEIGLSGDVKEKFEFVKNHLGKDISVDDVFKAGELIDVRGLTKGKGLQGAVRRFGIQLKSHKSEKGRRRAGSLGPWHPARVTFRVPQAGQLGMFTRVTYNNKIVSIKKMQDSPIRNIKNYGDIKTNYIVVCGSIQGPSKRQLIITKPLRPTRKQVKKDYELMELL